MLDSLTRLIPRPVRKFIGNLIAPYRWEGNETNQWLRIVMNRETERLIDALNPRSLKVLEISGTKWDRPAFFREYKSVAYPEYDVCSQVLDETFDLIIAEQVFEHILWPHRAAKNIHRMLNPDGVLLITTPFLIPIHKMPYDCTRWSDTGMKYFLADCGFPLEGIETASWGNIQCVRANLGGRWVMFQPWRHSLRNDPKYPCVVWALARKSGAA